MKMWAKNEKGFTIVELLIVIVVIGILAFITIVVYNGVQSRARDSARFVAAKSIKKGLRLYAIQSGSLLAAVPNPGVSSWEVSSDPGFLTSLTGVMSSIPSVPNTSTTSRLWYHTFSSGTFGCPASSGAFFILKIQGLEASDGISKSETGGCDITQFTGNMSPSATDAIFIGFAP